ncbi:MAG: dephospho-CoA kinase [Thermoguttaceae bacterium]
MGGIASGKSLVARQLGEMGAGILDADRVGHEVLRTPEVKRAALERWGRGILGLDGEIERSALAKVVFAAPPDGPREMSFLEQITHPEIERRLQDEAECMAEAGCRAIVLDAALLLEAGWNRLCDTLIFVDVPRSERCRRAQQRGWSESDFAAREKVQESLDLKRKQADAIINNSGTPERTREQLERVWHSLLG